MSTSDHEVRQLLDVYTPTYDDRTSDWNRVVASVRPRRSLRLRGIAIAGAAAAVVLIVLAWPFGSQPPGLLERARAAIGDGPVLHVVLRGEWGGTLLDLSTGARTPVYGDDEVWFDTQSGRTHSIERLGGVALSEDLSNPNKPAAELAALGREYRQALDTGTARVAENDVLDGIPVAWVTVHSELLPDVADGKDHEWTQQVAVSKESYRPVALRETRDGRQGPGTLQRVQELQLVSRAAADFTTSMPSLNGTTFREGRAAIAVDDAAGVLGRTALWPGAMYGGTPLENAYDETTTAGTRRRVRLTGVKADAAERCVAQRGAAGADCLRKLDLGSVEVTPDGVFTTTGGVRWQEPHHAVVFTYGDVTITESTTVSPFRRGIGVYTPPEGSLYLTLGGMTGYLQRDGLQIGIEAPSEDAVVGAARALKPMR